MSRPLLKECSQEQGLIEKLSHTCALRYFLKVWTLHCKMINVQDRTTLTNVTLVDSFSAINICWDKGAEGSIETHCRCPPGREQEGRDEPSFFRMKGRWPCSCEELTVRTEPEVTASSCLGPQERSDRNTQYTSVRCGYAYVCVWVCLCVSVPCRGFRW